MANIRHQTMRSWMYMVAIVGGLGFCPVALSSNDLQRFTYTQMHMGIAARLVVYAPDEPAARTACAAAFGRIAELDTIMSDYRVDSELNRLCAAAGGPANPISNDLVRVLTRAQTLSWQTSGAFDVTAGPLIRLWRTARRNKAVPLLSELQQVLNLCGWLKLHLDSPRHEARLEVAGMQLDLGGIAKGYAADEAQRVLKEHGVTRALVELGGDIVVSGAPPDAPGWRISVPNASEEGPVTWVLADCAISTSGDTEQYVIINGKLYSHVIDPRTGWALSGRMQTTVIAPDGITSDPVATALSVLGEKNGRRLLKNYYPDLKATFRRLHGTEGVSTLGSASFPAQDADNDLPPWASEAHRNSN